MHEDNTSRDYVRDDHGRIMYCVVTCLTLGPVSPSFPAWRNNVVPSRATSTAAGAVEELMNPVDAVTTVIMMRLVASQQKAPLGRRGFSRRTSHEAEALCKPGSDDRSHWRS